MMWTAIYRFVRTQTDTYGCRAPAEHFSITFNNILTVFADAVRQLTYLFVAVGNS